MIARTKSAEFNQQIRRESMWLKPQGISPVPEETARIARAAYPKGNVYMHMRDELGTIYEDEHSPTCFPQWDNPQKHLGA
jgi:hypothetical protein